jgi:hypothetical protein
VITSAGLESSPGVTPSARSSASFPRPDPNTAPPPPRPGSGKYAATSPVTPRASQPVQPPVKEPSKPRESLFGSDLLSEKSLDEVILSYLADELDEKK